MPIRQVGGPADALIVFADIVGSSRHSAVLGPAAYAQRLLEFQHTFTTLARRYFPEVTDRATQFCEVAARGDEGSIFVTRPQYEKPSKQSALVFRAIEFLYHLKARLQLVCGDRAEDPAPRRFDIGAGIHWGPVRLIIAEEANRSVISGIEGFAINYAKRVESCSREGRHSLLLLSSEAARCLEFEPVVLRPLHATMKGIEEDVQLFEVQSSFFAQMELDEDDDRLLEEAESLADNPLQIQSPWIKAFVVSALESASSKTDVTAEKKLLRSRQSALAWHSPKEDDPILLYLRSVQCRESGEHTRELRYLKDILKAHPDFVHIRLRLVKTCWTVTKSKAERDEKLFARDTAKEFLDHYARFLRGNEKADLQKLLRELTPRRSRPNQRNKRAGS